MLTDIFYRFEAKGYAAAEAVSVQDKVDQLIALCEKDEPLSASDVAVIRRLLAAGAGVVNGKGKSR